MSANVLRKAAALMRERAEAATAFTDAKTGAPLGWVNGLSGEVFDMGAAQVAQAIDHGTARHIGSWHPAVALAVADWLEESADHLALGEESDDNLTDHVCATALEGLDCSVLGQSVTVATAYLGADA